MILKIELPDDTVAGFINFVFGSVMPMDIGVIALDTEEIKNGTATYKSCRKRDKGIE
jgi:hypothetical protein